MLARLRSRAQEEKGFTLIELLVVVLIIGILAAIAIPAFLGQKKGAQDANAKSLLRNAAIALESYYSENQDFEVHTLATLDLEMKAIEPNIAWQVGGFAALAKSDQVAVHATESTGVAADPKDQYVLLTTSASTTMFSYFRNKDAKTYKCKDTTALTAVSFTAGVASACTANEW